MARFFPWVLAAERKPSGGGLAGRGMPTLRAASEKKSDGNHQASFGGPWRVIINTVAIFLFSQLIAALLVGLGAGLLRPAPPAAAENSIAGQFFLVTISEGLAAWITIWLVRRRGLSLKSIGLGRRPRLNDLKKAIAAAAILYVFLIALSLVLSALSPSVNNEQQDVGFNDIAGGFQNVLAFIALVIMPPIGEETLVRGYLYSGLRKAWRFWPALLVTGLLFAVPHLFEGNSGLLWSAGADTFVLSGVLVYLRENTGALYAGMLVHALHNLAAFLVNIK